MSVQEDLVRLIRPVVEQLGYEFVGLEYLSNPKNRLVRIYIDRSDDGSVDSSDDSSENREPDGISVDDCAKVSHEVSALLDVEDPDNRDRIARLLRFASTRERSPGSVSLATYLERAGEGQDTIWYLTGDSLEQTSASPHLEAFAAAGVEVLLLSDPIDPWWLAHLHEFEGKPLKSAASGQFEVPGKSEQATADDSTEADALCERIAGLLGDRVGKVRASRRLVDSASCLVEGADGMNLRMRRMLRQAGQAVPDLKPELEINPGHALVKRLAATEDEQLAKALADVLLDQAQLLDGGELTDPAGFVRRVNRLLAI